MKLSEQIKRCLDGGGCKECENYESGSRLTCPGLMQKAYEMVKKYEDLEKQRDKNYKYPYMAVGARVKVCFHYNTSKYCMGTLIRSDLEEPFEEIIRLDDGRIIRGVECQYSRVDLEEKESEGITMLHKVTITKTEEKMLEEYWLLRGIVNSEYIAGANTVCAEKEFEKKPTPEEISQFLYESNANFAAVEHNYRFVSDL